MQVTFVEDLRRFNKFYREMDEFYHKTAMKCGISDSAFWILYAICECGEECTQKEIGAKFAVSKQTIHSAIRKLEQDGILYLKQGNGRDKYICLTQEGEKFVEKYIAPVISVENEVFMKLGEVKSKKMLEAAEEYLNLLRDGYAAQNEEKGKNR